MKIGIANDHRGVKLKEKIVNYLHSKGISCVNYGTDTEDSVDYVDYAEKLCKAVISEEVNLGILICGTGIGMSIAANKIKGIRCGRVVNAKEATLTKEHNMANIIALPEDVENFEEIVDAFLETKYSDDERHIRRVNKIKKLEEA